MRRWEEPKTRRIAAGLAVVVLAAIAGGVFVRARRAAPLPRAEDSTPRGLAEDVRLLLYTTGDLRLVEENQRVTPNASFTGTYRSFRETNAYLAAFAVDANGKLHWMVPSAIAAADDAPSWALTPSPRELPFPSSLALRRAPVGPLRIVALVTPEPVPASQIEALSTAERQPAALRTRFHGAVREWVVLVANDGR